MSFSNLNAESSSDSPEDSGANSKASPVEPDSSEESGGGELLGKPESDPSLEVSAQTRSRLEAEVEAALRDVENLLSESATKLENDIDWSGPNLAPTPAEQTPPLETVSYQPTAEEEVPSAATSEAFASVNAVDVTADEQAIAGSFNDLEQRIAEAATERREAEDRLRLSVEWEVKFRAHMAARRSEEEELRRQAEAEAMARRTEEEEKLQAEYTVRIQTEEIARHFADEATRLRLEVLSLRQAEQEIEQKRVQVESAARAARLSEEERVRRATEERHNAELALLRSEEETLRQALEQTALRRNELEAARQESATQLQRLEEEKVQLEEAEAARFAAAQAMRREAENRSRTEQERLFLQVAELRRSAEEVARRRAEVEAARGRTEEDAERLREVQERIKVAEENRRQLAAERLRFEDDIRERSAAERRLIEKAQEEQQRLEEAARRRSEEEEGRLAKLNAFRISMDEAARAGAEKERQLIVELENAQIAEAEARKRIEEIEGSRRTADETLGLITEKLQRVEAEAHARRAEEQRILAKLEEARAQAAIEAQARAEEERRVKEEIALLYEREEEQRLKMQEAMRQRSDAESRLQQVKDQYHAEEAARVRAERQLERLVEVPREGAEEIPEWQDDPEKNLRQVRPAPQAQTTAALSKEGAVAGEGSPPVKSSMPVDESSSSGVVPFCLHDLNSPDPEQRTAALSALGEAGSKDAYSLIVDCFDDESPDVRNAAVWALREIDPFRPAESFTRALEEGSPERRKNIGSAIAASGLAAESLEALRGESREDTYNALCLLFTMAKAGEVQPLVQAIEEHANVDVRMAAVKLLSLSGQSGIAEAAAKRRLDGQRSNAQSA